MMNTPFILVEDLILGKTAARSNGAAGVSDQPSSTYSHVPLSRTVVVVVVVGRMEGIAVGGKGSILLRTRKYQAMNK
jgi:hypothetical protein